eukprot:37267-Amphidinium_carterae.2
MDEDLMRFALWAEEQISHTIDQVALEELSAPAAPATKATMPRPRSATRPRSSNRAPPAFQRPDNLARDEMSSSSMWECVGLEGSETRQTSQTQSGQTPDVTMGVLQMSLISSENSGDEL